MFGEDIVSKLKLESIDKGDTFYYLKSVLSIGAENQKAIKDKPNQKPIFSDQGLRDIAEMTAQILLKSKVLAETGSDEVVALIKPFLPGRTAQIEQKIALEKKMKAAEKTNYKDSDEFRILEEEIAEEADTASKSRAEKMQEQAKMMQDFKESRRKKTSR